MANIAATSSLSTTVLVDAVGFLISANATLSHTILFCIEICWVDYCFFCIDAASCAEAHAIAGQ